MKNKKTATDSFSALFWNSCKKTCFIPIIAFVYLFGVTIDNYIQFHNFHRKPNDVFGFFWNSTYDAIGLIELFLLVGGVIAGIILFRFAQSKKQCNVIFSLGMSRRKIFLAKYLGGLLPLFAALIIAAFFELVSVFCCGYALSAPLIKIAVYFVVCFMGYYTLAFTVTSAVTAYAGNIVETLIFIGMIALVPLAAGLLFGMMRGMYTLGGISVYEGKWNFFNPYVVMFKFLDIFNETSDYLFNASSITDYFSTNRETVKISVYDFSGAIMSFIYAGITFAIAFLAFPKRKNEISGTFGRAKGLNEICAVIAGLYLMMVLMYTVVGGMYDINDGSFFVFLLSVGFFVAAYFIFKMIFGHKRKLILKSMLKRIPACIAALAIVTVIFYTGLFGYASRIPDAEDIESIKYSTVLTNPYSTVNDSDALSRKPSYGYCAMEKYSGYLGSGGQETFTNGRGYQQSYYPEYTVEDESEIRELIEIHKGLIQKGHIKKTASDACGTNFQIIYNLKNGKTVKRYYTATDEEGAKQILRLSDSEVAKSNISEFFESGQSDNYGAALISNEELSQIPAEDNPNNYFCLYSKLLKESRRCGMITEELKKAVIKDLENQTAEDIFFHKPEDELGVISFENAFEYGVDVPEGYYMNEDGDLVNAETGEIMDRFDAVLRQARESMNKTDWSISAMGQTSKSFVVTKSMTNTVKYLTDNGYIKYFDTKITANDVKSMKLATKAESLNQTNIAMLPMFIAAYSSSEYIKEYDDSIDSGLINDTLHDFKRNVKNEITSKTTIQKVLDNCFLYGYSGSNDRVAEITFNDGSIATYCISAEVYDKLMK